MMILRKNLKPSYHSYSEISKEFWEIKGSCASHDPSKFFVFLCIVRGLGGHAHSLRREIYCAGAVLTSLQVIL